MKKVNNQNGKVNCDYNQVKYGYLNLTLTIYMKYIYIL